jgi:DNA processing protein
MLRSCDNRPLALYVAGQLDALKDPPLAVVGSRRPTIGGTEIAFDFSRALAARGVVIASGLAEGIDTAAHRGALEAQGLTLAVLGTGIERVYPESNRALSEHIMFAGALVSPFPLGTPPRRANFPQRNQVIAALSLGTLVVEAARSSGSLITARAAQRLGRPVLAVPGSIQNPMSRGCHRLIKEGAHLAESADDVLSRLDFSAFFARPREAANALQTPAPARAGMDKEHKILLDALGFDPADLDTLIVRTGFKPEAVSSMMLILELEGHVQAAPGGRYSRVANRRAGGER